MSGTTCCGSSPAGGVAAADSVHGLVRRDGRAGRRRSLYVARPVTDRFAGWVAHGVAFRGMWWKASRNVGCQTVSTIVPARYSPNRLLSLFTATMPSTGFADGVYAVPVTVFRSRFVRRVVPARSAYARGFLLCWRRAVRSVVLAKPVM